VVVIAGVAAAAATVIYGWNYLNSSPQAMGVVMGVRQQAGVIAVIVNAINAMLDALMLVKRVKAGQSSSRDDLLARLPSFGRDADEV
jgi:hypothetical protein